MNLIVAVDDSWGIGKNNQLLFRIKKDMKLFKELTIGKVVVMGRNTYISLPENNRPLPERFNIVLTKDTSWSHPGVMTCTSVSDLMKKLSRFKTSDIFIIGGESIYKQMLPYCTTAYVTKVNKHCDADRFMENLDSMPEWVPINVRYEEECSFWTYQRFLDI